MRLGSVIAVNPESVAKGYPHEEIEYVDISSVGTGTLKGTRRLALAGAPSRARRIVRQGDVLLATVRPNLRAFWFAREPPRNTVASTGFAVLRATCGIDERYLYYLISDQGFTDYLAANVKGAAYPAVDVETIRRAEVSIAPMETQRKVAAVLSAYDDLIENNLRRIEVLEEMARNFYREWFVEFRFPGHEGARFVKSPLGRLPGEWTPRTLGEVATIQTGRSNRQDAVAGGAFAFFDPSSEIKRSQRFLLDCEAVIVPGEGKEFLPRYWSGPFDLHQRVYALTDFRGISGLFLYFTLLHRREYFFRAATGATVKSLRKGMFERFEFALPTQELMSRFDAHVRDILALAKALDDRNSALREARDLLLPKLVSGEIDVSDLPVRMPPLYTGDPHRITGYRFFREITALPFVTKVVLFGSRARGDHEERSDIDLCVFCREGTTEEEWMQVLACLERDRVDTLLKVDCVRFETGNAALQENVLTEGIVLYERREGP